MENLQFKNKKDKNAFIEAIVSSKMEGMKVTPQKLKAIKDLNEGKISKHDVLRMIEDGTIK